MKIRFIFIGLILFCMTGMLWSQSVTVGSMSGKVEIRPPGMSWQSASEGMSVPVNSMISTGFASEAMIVMDNADITVKPLTRMTIQDFASSGSTTTTKLFLGAGKIRADVKRSSNLINDFQVRSPVATAAVRGTSFTFDGVTLEVITGSVDFFGQKGAKVNVSGGGKSEADEEGYPSDPAVNRQEDASVSPHTPSGDNGGPDDSLDKFKDSANSNVLATLKITIE